MAELQPMTSKELVFLANEGQVPLGFTPDKAALEFAYTVVEGNKIPPALASFLISAHFDNPGVAVVKWLRYVLSLDDGIDLLPEEALLIKSHNLMTLINGIEVIWRRRCKSQYRDSRRHRTHVNYITQSKKRAEKLIDA